MNFLNNIFRPYGLAQTNNLFGASRSIQDVFRRGLHWTAAQAGRDRRDITAGHLKKSDLIEGENFPINETSRNSSIAIVDENLDNMMFEGTRFADLPVMHIKCTRNNTKISLRRADGIVMKQSSCGVEGYKNCRKGTTVAAQAVASRLATAADDLEIKAIRLVVQGLGPGRNAAVKTLQMAGLNFVSITDRTSACEPWKARPRAAKSI